MTVSYQVECDICRKQFFVPAEHQHITICDSCECFEELMERLMQPRAWEKPGVTPGFKRGLKFAMFIVAPLWLLYYFLVLRWK